MHARIREWRRSSPAAAVRFTTDDLAGSVRRDVGITACSTIQERWVMVEHPNAIIGGWMDVYYALFLLLVAAGCTVGLSFSKNCGNLRVRDDQSNVGQNIVLV